MADLTPQERLQPALLDRLTDTDRASSVESRERRVLSIARLRAGVLRDLAWLMNTGHLEATQNLEHYAFVRDSVLNFGVPDYAGTTASGADPARLAKTIRDAIIKFEPRIDSRTLKVTANVDPDRMSRNAVTFTIEGELWAQPTPLALYLKTELDLETGDVSVSER
jgi:type VI secretion system protein ImpF